MSEKKTFKNVSSVINTFDPEHTWVVEGFRMKSNEFTHREWDMEVTFTKKEDPFRVNDQVILTGGGELAIIWHIIADRAWVNVVASSGGSWRDSHHVVKLSELKHAS